MTKFTKKPSMLSAIMLNVVILIVVAPLKMGVGDKHSSLFPTIEKCFITQLDFVTEDLRKKKVIVT
jgi:hypothetical protein